MRDLRGPQRKHVAHLRRNLRPTVAHTAATGRPPTAQPCANQKPISRPPCCTTSARTSSKRSVVCTICAQGQRPILDHHAHDHHARRSRKFGRHARPARGGAPPCAYGPFNPYIPIRSTTIGKSRVAKDPIAMHTSWRSNSDIASVTRVSMTFRVVRTNQYNQDLGLIHSTNGNHLENPNEGSSIDHQVTIYLYAQNITIFPTNETCIYDDVMVATTSFFNSRHANVMVAESRYLSISNADRSTVHLLLRSFLQSLANITAAGPNWPPPDYEQPTQLWTSPLSIQLPFTMIDQTSCELCLFKPSTGQILLLFILLRS
ncbi:Tau class glutathione S-transferase [Dorcoceras hygrometricum]|uniref:Tau class glutathione S-transferase n=1 Tax=Dorcoceras hygrometricum TaxID=472368 RepID=A0A2Z7CTS2_9LAMI|nr:Tau class glutathione S-transferase [Dorcoceras hygrometricum]